jgi:hypothetical protein
MKRITLLFLLVSMSLIPMCAQENSQVADFVKQKVIFDVHADYSTGSKTHLSQGIDLGIMLGKRAYAFAGFGNQWTLYKQDGEKNYYSATLIGGGLGFRWLHNDEHRMSLDTRIKVGQSIGGNSISCTMYDVGIHLRLGGNIFVPTIGFGFRHEHIHTRGLSNQNHMYLSVGIGL